MATFSYAFRRPLADIGPDIVAGASSSPFGNESVWIGLLSFDAACVVYLISCYD